MLWTRSKKQKKSKNVMNQKKIQELDQKKKKKEIIIGRKMKKNLKFKMNPIKRYIIKMETW